MIFEHADYRGYLKAELAERVGANPSYSMRAFARGLNLAPSSLSDVLRGKINLSLETSLIVASRLGLSDREAEYFSLLVRYDAAKNPELKETLQTRINTFRPKRKISDLSVDYFKMIADWYHAAILELADLPGFSMRAEAIAKKLGISTIEAQAAIERLERLELLEKNSKGRLSRVQNNLLFQSKSPNGALRKFHKQMMERAIESLEIQTPKEKIVGSETFLFDPDQIEEAREIAEFFFEKMSALAKKSKKRDQVYHLGVQFFNLTHSNFEKRERK